MTGLADMQGCFKQLSLAYCCEQSHLDSIA